MTHHTMIVNPTSGRGAGERSIPQIEQLFKNYNLDYSIIRTERPWHAAEIAQQAVADGSEVVVAVGGDGTANEVLNGLMLAKQKLDRTSVMGILSVGRGNDFAYGMHIPSGVEAGCQVLAQGHRQLVDIGLVRGGDYPQGRYFGNGVGIGFDAVVGFVALKMTYLTGFLSYIVAALKTIFLYYHAPLVSIEFDGESFQLPSLMVSIMNGRRMGGGFMMAPKSFNNDGLFDLCIARQVNRARIFTLIPHFMKGTQGTQEPIRFARARKVVVKALQGSLPAHADGETLCTAGLQLALELLPNQVEVICQPEEQTA